MASAKQLTIDGISGSLEQSQVVYTIGKIKAIRDEIGEVSAISSRDAFAPVLFQYRK